MPLPAPLGVRLRRFRAEVVSVIAACSSKNAMFRAAAAACLDGAGVDEPEPTSPLPRPLGSKVERGRGTRLGREDAAVAFV